MLREIPVDRLTENIKEMCIEVNYCLSEDMEAALRRAAKEEASPLGRQILNQLEAMKRGDFTDEELLSAKLSVCNGYRTVGDYLGSTESWYISQVFLPNPQTPEQAAEEISGITREEVIAAAQKVTLDTVYRLAGTGEE